MKTLSKLFLINGVFLLGLGHGMAWLGRDFLPWLPEKDRIDTLGYMLGMIAGNTGILLCSLRNLLTYQHRYLGVYLSASGAMALLAVTRLLGFAGPAWLQPLRLSLVVLAVWMAAAAVWNAFVLAWHELSAESLPIPEEIRRSWLRQIGEAAVQEERNRLARDLHDSIKQQLFTINVSTAAAQELWEQNPVRARAALSDVRRSAREAMVEMQALLHQLQPRALVARGLIEALREQCEALGYRTGAEVSLELGEAIPDDRLPSGAQETLFRIAQESLANVARHARARNVRVWLGKRGGSALLQVKDDGRGFDPAVEATGMGLRNLRERAQSLRGRLEIISTPGAGTTIEVEVPLMRHPPTEGAST